MAEKYNPDILHKYAATLYAQARSPAAWTALRYGVVFGLVVSLAVAIASPLGRMRIDTSSANTAALIAGVAVWPLKAMEPNPWGGLEV